MSSLQALRAATQAAQAARDLVNVRRLIGWQSREGYVAGVGLDWLLLAMVDDRSRADGFSAVRLQDVVEIERVEHAERFVRRALEMAGEWPTQPRPSGVSLDLTRDLLLSLADLYPVVSVYTEAEDPDVCYIGKVTVPGSEQFSLREISTNAEWVNCPPEDQRSWPFRDVTRIDVGGGYETALVLVANDGIED